MGKAMNEQHISGLTHRLERLERAIRWWRGATLLSCMVMVAVFLMGQTLPSPRVIEAEGFVLRDHNGKIRVVVGPRLLMEAGDIQSVPKDDDREYGVHLYTSEGRHVAQLSVSDDVLVGASLQFSDTHTGSSAYLGVRKAHAALSLISTTHASTDDSIDQKELLARAKAAQTSEERNRLFTAIQTPEGRRRMLSVRPSYGMYTSLVADAEATVGLDIGRGSQLTPRGGIRFDLFKDGQSVLQLSDEKGVSRAVLGHTTLERTTTGVVEQRPVSSLVLFDKNAHAIWKAP